MTRQKKSASVLSKTDFEAYIRNDYSFTWQNPLEVSETACDASQTAAGSWEGKLKDGRKRENGKSKERKEKRKESNEKKRKKGNRKRE